MRDPGEAAHLSVLPARLLHLIVAVRRERERFLSFLCGQVNVGIAK